MAMPAAALWRSPERCDDIAAEASGGRDERSDALMSDISRGRFTTPASEDDARVGEPGLTKAG